jgi:hypothetical protein
MEIKCVICGKPADFVFAGFSYCYEHLEIAKVNYTKQQQGLGNLFLNLQNKMGGM